MRSQTEDGEATQREQQQGAAVTLKTEATQRRGDVIEVRSQRLPGGSWDLGGRGLNYCSQLSPEAERENE